MMFKSRPLLLLVTAAVFFTACSGPATPRAAAPTADALLALEKQAADAYIQGDGKFFESFLSATFVLHEAGPRLSKAETVRMISGVKCQVEEGWALTTPNMARIDNDTYVLSYESNREGSCTANGTTERLPSPVRAATVWTRNGEQWQPVFHGKNRIVGPEAAPAADQQEEPKHEDEVAENTRTAAAPITDALMAAEQSIWQAWKDKDAKKLEELTAAEITFVNIFGAYFANKAEVMKDWTGATCQVTGFTLTDGVGTAVSPTVGILTLTGTVSGTCGGMDISGQKIHADTVYVKDGDVWKWVFGFNSPS